MKRQAVLTTAPDFHVPLRALRSLACNTQAEKDSSEDKNGTKRKYLSVLKNLKALHSGLRPTGHSQPYLNLPLCGPLSFQAWLGNPRAEEEPREDVHDDEIDYLAG